MLESERQKFMALEKEKRDRIINAALKEFNKGYKHASTDAIVRDAGVSKGLLFHYFGNKAGLFEFLLDYASEVVKTEYFSLVNFEQRDILERLWQTVLLKVDLSYKYPMMFDFLTTAYKEDVDGTVTRLKSNILAEAAPKIYSNVDESLFKDDINPKMAVNIIYWAQLGFSHSQMDKINSTDLEEFQKEYENILKELQEYFALYRKIFYK